MKKSVPTRREFLQASAAAAATIPYFWTSRLARAQSANDRLNIAAIGVSTYVDRYTGAGEHDGQGSSIGRRAGEFGNLVACCDVDSYHAERFAAPYDGKCQIYSDYRKLLERDDIEAVTIGTPDHWHVKIAVEAMQAGKHVYCEKPLTLTIEEGQLISEAVRKTGKVCQVGTQQRSEYNQIFLKAVAIARSGRLGKKLHALSSVGQGKEGGPFENSPVPDRLDWNMWLGQAPSVPYCKQRCHYDFRYWMEYSNGHIADWGVHHTDIAIWALDDTNQGVVEVTPKEWYFPKIENGFNTAVRFDCDLKLANGNVIRLYSGTNELIISGELGRIRVNRGGLTGRPVEELTEADDQWIDEEIQKLCHGKKPGNHMANFFECIREGGLPISDVFSHVQSANACHMSAIAMQLGRKLQFDPEKQVFTGDDEATAMIARERREGFDIVV